MDSETTAGQSPSHTTVFRINASIQTDRTELADIKELERLYENLRRDLTISKETLNARYQHDMHMKLLDLWSKIRTHVQIMTDEQRAAEARLRQAAQTRVSDAVTKLSTEFKKRHEEAMSSIKAAHSQQLQELRATLEKTNFERIRAADKAKRMEHVVWRQSQVMQRHGIPETEIRVAENAEGLLEQLQEETHQKDETISELESRVFELETELKRYEAAAEERGPSRLNTAGSTKSRKATPRGRTPNAAQQQDGGINNEDSDDIADSLIDQEKDTQLIQLAMDQMQKMHETKMNELKEEMAAEKAKSRLEISRMVKQQQKQLTAAKESVAKVQNQDTIQAVLDRQQAILKFAAVLFDKKQRDIENGTTKDAIDGNDNAAAEPPKQQ